MIAKQPFLDDQIRKYTIQLKKKIFKKGKEKINTNPVLVAELHQLEIFQIKILHKNH